MKKIMQSLLFSLALCSGIVISNEKLYAMSSPADGLKAPKSCSDTAEKLWWWAVNNNHPTIVHGLTLFGIDPNIRPNPDIYYGDSPALILTMLNDDHNPASKEKMIKALLEARAEPNVKDKFGNSSLMLAAQKGLTNIVSLLLDARANPNIRDEDGYTPLMWAAYRSDIATCKVLLNAEADITLSNSEGNTALMLASLVANKEIISLLIRYQASKNPSCWNDTFILNFINATNNAGQTALILATKPVMERSKHAEAIEVLLGFGADATIRDKRGWTALDYVDRLQYAFPSRYDLIYPIISKAFQQ